MSHSRTIHQSHLGWDNSLEPAARIAPGEILRFDVLDAAGGQISPASTVEAEDNCPPAASSTSNCKLSPGAMRAAGSRLLSQPRCD